MSLVAIVGRPNVGKSTLFNRLVGMRQAIVDDISGVTRDRHYGRCEWCGREFSVVDTGGYASNSDDVFESAIRSQVEIAIEEADAILFMVEAATGITDYDEQIARLLRRSGKPVVLCVNKVDSGEKMYDAYQFYAMGFEQTFAVSAASGSGTGDLLDAIVALIPEESEDSSEHKDHPRLYRDILQQIRLRIHAGRYGGHQAQGQGTRRSGVLLGNEVYQSYRAL